MRPAYPGLQRVCRFIVAPRLLHYSGISIIAALLGACGPQSTMPQIPEDAKVSDLYIVDCLLPGQVRQLGNTTYLTPRRPTRTTAIDCRIRGGEYVAYDQADYKTALRVWMGAAEGGDPEAQNAVGEIFERGLGTEPNYEAAALWFERAAQQGHKAAQFNLGTLYEAGKGVPQDRIIALNWYRKAWGLSDDALAYRSEADAAVAAAEQTAAQAMQSAAQAEQALVDAQRETQRLQRENLSLSDKIDSLRKAAPAPERQPDAPARGGSAERAATASRSRGDTSEVIAGGRNYGRYYALIIGNSNYEYYDDLMTPLSDVDKIGRLLADKYGFNVQMLTDGDDASVMRAVNRLNDVLTEQDNLLIYYSGHGNRRQTGSFESGYWLPVNAEPAPDDTFWVPTEQISSHLARLSAKRVMVITDSSFAGLLADNPAFLLATHRDNLVSESYINLRFGNKSRLLLTSGQDAPLASERDASVSVFAYALLQALETNNRILTAPALFLSMLDELDENLPGLDPDFKAIKRAGDEIGEFFFVAHP
jgi:uncharacterized protein